MLFKNAKLKARIIELYGSQAAFGKALGVSETTVNYKLNNRRKMTIDDITQWKELLSIKDNELKDYFFAEKVK